MIHGKEFERVTRKQRRRLVLQARRMLFGSARADDLVQTAFMELWKTRRKISCEKHLRALLKRRLDSRCIDHNKKASLVNFISIELSNAEESEGSDDAHRACVTEETLADRQAPDVGLVCDVQRAVGTLPPLTRMIIKMCGVWGLTQSEAGHRLQISRDKVARLFTAGCKAARKLLVDYRPGYKHSTSKKYSRRRRTKYGPQSVKDQGSKPQ